MILTVTMNPAIDTAYQLDKLIIDDVNRVAPKKTAGGKGLNVSRVLCQLGDDVVATGLLGGHMGAYMGSLMDADGINHDFTPIAGETRICLNILHEGNQTELLESGGGHMGAYMGSLMDADGINHDFTPIAGETRICLNILHEGNQTELLESGPEISAEELAAFSAKFAELVAKADCVTISGSLPKGVPADFYAGMVAEAAKHDVPVLLDTSGASLDAALEAEVKPTLVKPNLTEINALLGTSYTPRLRDHLRLPAQGRARGFLRRHGRRGRQARCPGAARHLRRLP